MGMCGVEIVLFKNTQRAENVRYSQFSIACACGRYWARQ